MSLQPRSAQKGEAVGWLPSWGCEQDPIQVSLNFSCICKEDLQGFFPVYSPSVCSGPWAVTDKEIIKH